MFTTHLILEAAPEPDMWITRGALIWCDTLFGRISVPLGFYTDLASIPRALRGLPAFDPNGHSRRPAVVHDWLYQSQHLPKAVADAFLRASMIWDGASVLDADAFYEAVTIFGMPAWIEDGRCPMTAAFVDAASYAAYLATGT